MSGIFDPERTVLHYMTAGVITAYMLSIVSAVAGYAYENECLEGLALALAAGATATGIVTATGRAIFFD